MRMMAGLWITLIVLGSLWHTGQAECPVLQVSGADVQTTTAGTYILTEFKCNQRNVYHHVTNNVYVYFYNGDWSVGPYKCDPSRQLRVTDNAMYPGDVTKSWLEYDYTKPSWVTNYDISLVCYKGCPVLTVIGMPPELEHLEGNYTRTSSECNNRPVYQGVSTGGKLFYVDRWVIGARSCVDDSISVSNPAQSYLPQLAHLHWVVASTGLEQRSIDVYCHGDDIYPGCGTVQVSGAESHNSVNGHYSLLVANCSGGRAYVQSSVNNYLHYSTTSNRWMISTKLCSSEFVVISGLEDDTVVVPEDAKVPWLENSASLIANRDLSVDCYYSCADLKLSGSTAVNGLLNGVYTATHHQCHSRRIYQRNAGTTTGPVPVYLSFYQDTNFAGWLVGVNSCNDTGIIKAEHSTTLYPELVTSTWEEVVEGNWIPRPAITVSCQGRTSIRTTTTTTTRSPGESSETGAGSGEGLECYQCSTSTDDDCGQPGSPTADGCTFCRTDSGRVNGVTVTRRSCVMQCDPTTATCCTSDLCNQGNTATSGTSRLDVMPGSQLSLVILTAATWAAHRQL